MKVWALRATIQQAVERTTIHLLTNCWLLTQMALNDGLESSQKTQFFASCVTLNHLKQAKSTSDRFSKLENELDTLITNTETSPGVTPLLLHHE